jgi:hypothetical protein
MRGDQIFTLLTLLFEKRAQATGGGPEQPVPDRNRSIYWFDRIYFRSLFQELHRVLWGVNC